LEIHICNQFNIKWLLSPKRQWVRKSTKEKPQTKRTRKIHTSCANTIHKDVFHSHIERNMYMELSNGENGMRLVRRRNGNRYGEESQKAKRRQIIEKWPSSQIHCT